MAWVMIDKFIENQFDAGALNIDVGGVAMKVALLTASHTPAPTTEDLFSGISSNEVATNTAYTAGGIAVTGQSVVLSGGTVTIDIDDVVIAQDSGGFTNARYAYLYATVSGQLITFADLTSDRSIVSGSLTLEIDANGVFTVT